VKYAGAEITRANTVIYAVLNWCVIHLSLFFVVSHKDHYSSGIAFFWGGGGGPGREITVAAPNRNHDFNKIATVY
jgi:hypothetical protein